MQDSRNSVGTVECCLARIPGGAERAEKIRTYNFPQGRVTDHRINLTLYKLNDIMDGDLTETIEALQLEDQKAAMEAV